MDVVRRREVYSTVGLAVTLLLYGNLWNLFTPSQTSALNPPRIAANLLLMLTVVAWAIAVDGLRLSSLGMGRRNAPKSSLVGIALGLVLPLPVILVFAFPVVVEGPIEYEDVKGLSPGELVLRLGVAVPLGTALAEEVIFRGVLHTKLSRLVGDWRAVLLGAGVFALWHVVINYQTVQDTNVSPHEWLVALANAASLLGVFIGSILFSLLRLATGHLAAPFFTHWLLVASFNAGLYLLSR